MLLPSLFSGGGGGYLLPRNKPHARIIMPFKLVYHNTKIVSGSQSHPHSVHFNNHKRLENLCHLKDGLRLCDPNRLRPLALFRTRAGWIFYI